MSLETQLKETTQAITRLCNLLENTKIDKADAMTEPAKTPKKSVKTVKSAKAKPAEISKDELQALMVKVAQTEGKSVVMTILNNFDANRIGQLPEDKYEEASQQLQAALQKEAA